MRHSSAPRTPRSRRVLQQYLRPSNPTTILRPGRLLIHALPALPPPYFWRFPKSIPLTMKDISLVNPHTGNTRHAHQQLFNQAIIPLNKAAKKSQQDRKKKETATDRPTDPTNMTQHRRHPSELLHPEKRRNYSPVMLPLRNNPSASDRSPPRLPVATPSS